MSHTPAVFTFTAQAVRVVTDEHNNPWFCVADVCDVLGYANSRDALAKHCRAGGVAKRDTPTNSGTQPLTFIDEGNLYRLIIKSRKPEAEKFEAWVCDEVLPSIRKTGRYVAPQAVPAERYIDLTTHPEIRDFVRKLEHLFWFGGSASHNAWGNLRKLGGCRATAFPESQVPRALEEIKRIAERAEQFFQVKCDFEQAAIKWVFGTDAEMLDEPHLPKFEQLRLN